MANSVFTPATNATIERLIRLGGVGGIIGGVLPAAAYLTHPSEALPETLASSSWIWVHAGFMISLVCCSSRGRPAPVEQKYQLEAY